MVYAISGRRGLFVEKFEAERFVEVDGGGEVEVFEGEIGEVVGDDGDEEEGGDGDEFLF